MRARVYEPKSVDATETTVLTPRAGAPHSEAFQVATVQGLSGYRPYLDRVVGRAGSIDPLTKSVDVGVLSLVLGDIRTGTSDTSRWLTAFCGDTAGRWALPACRVEVDECLDWDGSSGTWTRYFTGRTEPLTAESLLRRGMRVRDLSTDLDQPVFDGTPHADVASYAARARLWPLGCPIAWGPFPAQATMTVDAAAFELLVDTGEAVTPRVLTRLARSLSDLPGSGFPAYYPETPLPARVFVTWTSGTGAPTGTTVEYALSEVLSAPVTGGAFSDAPRYLSGALIRDVDGSEPSIGSDWIGEMWLEPPADSPPTAQLPLFIDDVHPVQFWKDLCLGYFGQLNATSGDPDFPVAINAAAFDALIADTSFGTCRFLIDERADSLRDFIEEEICAPFNLTYRVNADGEIVPIDLRRPSTTPSSVSIGSSDLLAVPDRATWEPGGGAVGRLEVSYYVDASDYDSILASGPTPDISPSLVRSTEQRLVVVAPSARAADLARKPLKITSRGVRAAIKELRTSTETDATATKVKAIEQQFTQLAADLDEAFGLGPMYAILRCARGTGRPAESVVPGSWVSVTCSELENPATVQRTGTRLMRCVEVSDEGEQGLERRLRLLDPGPNPVAGPPNPPTAASVFGTPTTTGGVVRFTMPLSNMPASLRIYRDGVVYGADVAVTAGLGATQDVTISGLSPSTTYSMTARGVSASGTLSTSASPAASLTTAAATTIPTPTLAGSIAGSVVSLTITPGVGNPSGVEWVILQDSVEIDSTFGTTWSDRVGPGDFEVYGRKSGFPDSALSNTVSL